MSEPETSDSDGSRKYLISQLCEITGVDQNRANKLLLRAQDDLNVAADIFYSEEGTWGESPQVIGKDVNSNELKDSLVEASKDDFEQKDSLVEASKDDFEKKTSFLEASKDDSEKERPEPRSEFHLKDSLVEVSKDDFEQEGPKPRSEFHLKEVEGDLFTSRSSLCHCVSRDYRLGKGIAKIFREKFGRIQELHESGAEIGDVATLKVGDRYIYNLVTKAKYFNKPTYESLRKSLEAMKEHALQNQVNSIAMPKIGCGLDGLKWPTVKTIIQNVFQNHNIQVTVYCLSK